MNYYMIPPSNRLEEYVRFYWVFKGEAGNVPYVYRSMADSCTELLFHYRGTFDMLSPAGERTSSFRSGIHGQTETYQRFETCERFGIFGVYLYPYAIRRLFGLSPRELTDQMPDLHSALGRKGRELEERMMLAADNKIRHGILATFLEEQLVRLPEETHPAESAVRYLVQSKKQHRVRNLAGRFNLSERQFVRKFKEYAGMNPKTFMRIVRFGEACNWYGDGRSSSLTEIAYRCGYYDQSHFIRDFKEFSGYVPGDFFAGEAEGVEWREA